MRPTAPGTYSFTVELRDYDSLSTPVTKTFQITVLGSDVPPSPTPSSSTPTPSPTPSASVSPSTPARGCTATYAVVGQWTGGFQGDVTVTAGSAPVNGWTVTWTYANGQTITQSWGATITSSGTAVTATNVSYNGSLAAGASTHFGFLGTSGGANGVPAVTCTAR